MYYTRSAKVRDKIKNMRLDVQEQIHRSIEHDRRELTEAQKRVAELYLTKHVHGMDNKSIMEAAGHTTPRVIYKWLADSSFINYMERLVTSDPARFILPDKYRRYNYVDTQRASAEIRERELLHYVQGHPTATFQQMADD